MFTSHCHTGHYTKTSQLFCWQINCYSLSVTWLLLLQFSGC